MLEDRYAIRCKISQGGVGAVYRAFDRHLNREVAIKRVFAEGGYRNQEEATTAMLKEVTALCSIQHPHIVTVFDADVDEDGPYVVMELLSGRTINEMIEHGVLTIEDFREVALQTQEALIAAQDLELVHRDIKPTNLMVTWLVSGRFQVKLADFGLAKFSPKPSLQTNDHTDSIHFMAPEQFERTPLDQRSDMYSLGCVYYYCLTSSYPFDGENTGQVITSHLQNTVTPISELRPDLPTWMSDWVMWHLARPMDDRPCDAREALQSFLMSENNPKTETPEVPPHTSQTGTPLIQPQDTADPVNTSTAPQPSQPPADQAPSIHTAEQQVKEPAVNSSRLIIPAQTPAPPAPEAPEAPEAPAASAPPQIPAPVAPPVAAAPAANPLLIRSTPAPAANPLLTRSTPAPEPSTKIPTAPEPLPEPVAAEPTPAPTPIAEIPTAPEPLPEPVTAPTSLITPPPAPTSLIIPTPAPTSLITRTPSPTSLITPTPAPTSLITRTPAPTSPITPPPPAANPQIAATVPLTTAPVTHKKTTARPLAPLTQPGMSNSAKAVIVSTLIAGLIIAGFVAVGKKNENNNIDTLNAITAPFKDLENQPTEVPLDKNKIQLLLDTISTAGAKEKGEREIYLQALLKGESTDGTDISEMIAKYAKSVDMNTGNRLKLFRLLEIRGERSALPHLIEFASQPAVDVTEGQAALKATRKMDTTYNFKSLLTIITTASDSSIKSSARDIISEAIRKSNRPGNYTRDIIETYKTSTHEDAKVALLRLMGASGGDEAAAIISEALNGNNDKMKIAAVYALRFWPDASQFNALYEYASTEESERPRNEAFKASIDFLRDDHEIPNDTLGKHWQNIANIASGPTQQIQVIDSMVTQKGTWPNAILESFLNQGDNDKVKIRAEKAIAYIAQRLKRSKRTTKGKKEDKPKKDN